MFLGRLKSRERLDRRPLWLLVPDGEADLPPDIASGLSRGARSRKNVDWEGPGGDRLLPGEVTWGGGERTICRDESDGRL